MDPLERGITLIIRLIAATLILLTVMDLSLYVVVCLHNQKQIEVVTCITQSLPMLVGIVLLVKTKAISCWVRDKLE